MVSWPAYSAGSASQDFNKLTPGTITEVSINQEFTELRKRLLQKWNDLYDEHGFDAGIKDKYKYDLEIGLILYKELKDELEQRDVAADDTWRFLSIKVVPEIVHARWGLDEGRFYKNRSRIYLKQAWQYVNLGWNKDIETTRDILKSNTTDTILQLVERPGLGYDIDLYREIMKKHSEISGRRESILRQVLLLNTARSKVISPELSPGGITGYVNQLFQEAGAV